MVDKLPSLSAYALLSKSDVSTHIFLLQQKAEAFMRAESLKDLAYMFSESHKLPIVFNEETSSFQVAMPDDTISSPAKDKILPLLDDSANNENVSGLLNIFQSFANVLPETCQVNLCLETGQQECLSEYQLQSSFCVQTLICHVIFM